MTRQLAERRKQDRVPSNLPCPTLELGETSTSAVLKNISRSGLACFSYTPIPEMTVVELKMQLPALHNEEVESYSFQGKGAVVRCEPVKRSSSRRKWLIAIFFTEVEEAQQQVLDQYITVRS